MNVHSQTYMSGQVPNQMQQPQQQNGNAIPTQMQNLGNAAAHRATFSMDHELHRARGYMQDKILGILLKRQLQPINEGQRSKLTEIVKCLEVVLFRKSHTKEEYLNMDTLESRLQNLLRPSGTPANARNQQYQQLVNSSTSAGTMIPTPGMPHGGNSNLMVTSSVDTSVNSIASANVNTGSLLQTGNVSSIGAQGGNFNTSDGNLESYNGAALSYEPK